MRAWKKSAQYDPIWPRLAPIGLFGHYWLYKALCGAIWPRLAQFDPVWHHLAMFGPAWPHLALLGHSSIFISKFFKLRIRQGDSKFHNVILLLAQAYQIGPENWNLFFSEAHTSWIRRTCKKLRKKHNHAILRRVSKKILHFPKVWTSLLFSVPYIYATNLFHASVPLEYRTK